MKIATYNVNGIRAAMGKGLAEWIEAAGPDVLCLQETKAQPDQIPVFEFSTLGYETYAFSAQKKGYSGVAILTRRHPDKVAPFREQAVHWSQRVLLSAASSHNIY